MTSWFGRLFPCFTQSSKVVLRNSDSPRVIMKISRSGTASTKMPSAPVDMEKAGRFKEGLEKYGVEDVDFDGDMDMFVFQKSFLNAEGGHNSPPLQRISVVQEVDVTSVHSEE